MSALFAFEGVWFKKHGQVQAAVHRDLVNTGLWPKSLGSDYGSLLDARDIADYGVEKQVTQEKAAEAIAAAERIIQAVSKSHPDLFKLPTEG